MSSTAKSASILTGKSVPKLMCSTLSAGNELTIKAKYSKEKSEEVSSDESHFSNCSFPKDKSTLFWLSPSHTNRKLSLLVDRAM